MFAKILLLYLHWHGYRLNVIKLLPHKINYTVLPARKIPPHIDPHSCFGKTIISPTPLRLPSWWNLLGQRNIPQWKCSQLEDEWEVPPSYRHHRHHRHHLFFLHCWYRYSDTRWKSSMVDSIGIPLHPNNFCVTGKKLILYSMMTITLELAYPGVLFHDQEGIVSYSDV